MKMQSIRKTGLLLGTMLCLPVPAFAQTQTPPQPQAQPATPPAATSKDDIIVTARRTEERLQDVPISIKVYNQAALTDNNIVNPGDLAIVTPSLSANVNFGNQNSSYAIRGFVQDSGTAPSVGVYFADVVAPRAASNGIPAGDGAGPGAFFDLQNVQVLKGPQGTLFGRNTTGGAVLLVPQKPTDKLEGYVMGSVGNYDMWRGQAVINVPLSDTFRVRLGVDRMTRKGYLNNTSGVGPKDMDDVDYWTARASVVADVTPNLENYTIFSYTRSSTNGDQQKLIAADPAFSLGSFAAAQLADQAANHEGFYDVRQDLPNAHSLLTQWQVINTTTWKASDSLTIKNIISYAQLLDQFNNPIFGTAFQSPAISAIGLPSFRFGFSSSQYLPGHSTANESTFTEELQFQGRVGDNFTWQAGGYFESVQPRDTVGSQSPVIESCANGTAVAAFQCYDILGYLGAVTPVFFGGSFNPNSHAGAINLTAGQTSFQDVGLYAQGTYKLSDHFRVTAGFRYTWDTEHNTSTQTTTITGYPLSFPGFLPIPAGPLFTLCTYADAPVQNPTAANGCTRSFTQNSNKPTWLIDLDYTPSDDVLLYGKYSRGYRSGGIAPNVSPPYTVFGPESVDAFEIGAKTSWHGAVSGTFNIAGFYNAFSNQQLQLGFNANPCQSMVAGACVAAPVTPTAAPINAGRSRIYGVEVDATIRPFAGLTLEADYTYLNTRIDSVPTFTLQPGSPFVVAGAYLVGDQLELSPKNKVTISATYQLPLPDRIGKISIGGSFTHTDSMVTNPADRFYAGCTGAANVGMAGCMAGDASPAGTAALIQSLSSVPATDLLNLHLDWTNAGGLPVDLGLFATNVTGEQYYTYIPGLAGGTGFETASIGAPRMYGLNVKVHFGQ